MSERTALRTGKVALVTGTSSGIGAAVAAQLLERGWSVVGLSRRDAAFADARYEHLYIDLADHAALARVVERELAPRLRDDNLARFALVNNAALGALLSPLQNIDPAKLLELYAINVAAPVWLMGFASRKVPTSLPLRIVNVSSGAAVRAFPGLAAYGSAKAALRLAGMVLAEEWRSPVPNAPTRTDAAILSYEPGAVDTPMQAAARESSAKEFPWVAMFQSFLDAGMLVPAAVPAAEIVAFVESDDQMPFTERRLGSH
jgi:benzil reductase ((S)-benzoin forming)